MDLHSVRQDVALCCVDMIVLGPACNEYNKLTDELEVERACRTEVEKFATQVR